MMKTLFLVTTLVLLQALNDSYRMTNGRLDVRIFLLAVKVTRPVLILPNYPLKLLER